MKIKSSGNQHTRTLALSYPQTIHLT